ncbi:MAG TPA: hypothetical protein PLM79_13880 [Syntrophobacteraceae bacterium]|nr:hypothetical protein [Syntrophobacteraceae bacterium]
MARYRDRLEDLVEERTAALARVNEQLQREIEERRKAEEALRESRQMLESVLDTIPVRLFRKDPDSIFAGSIGPNRTGRRRSRRIGCAFCGLSGISWTTP